MAEIEPIEIINNNPEIIEDKPIEIIEDKPIEIIDRRKIKKQKKVEEEPAEKIDKRKILRALWRTTILEDGTKKYNNRPCDPLYFKKYYDNIYFVSTTAKRDKKFEELIEELDEDGWKIL